MGLVSPPLFFYAFGTVLVVAGTWRALTLGRRRPEREVADDDPTRDRARRRHLRMGIVWVLLGVFLIGSTAARLRSKAEQSVPPAADRDPDSAPVIRLAPAPPPAAPPGPPANAAPPAQP